MPEKEIDYLDYVKKLNDSPIFTSLAKNFDYKKIGLQILNDKKTVKEFTSHNKGGKITKIEEGIKDPEFTIKVEEETVKQLASQKEQDWIKKHPVEAAMKYIGKVKLPFAVKIRLLKMLSKL